MKIVSLILSMLVSVSAFADTSMGSESLPANAVVAPNNQALDQPYHARTISVEVGAQFIGDSQSSQSLVTPSGYQQSYKSSDSLYVVTVRRDLSPEFDLSVTIPIVSRISNQQSYQYDMPVVWVNPFSIGGRYHVNFFGDLIRPFAQVDLGEAYISENNYNSGIALSTGDQVNGTGDNSFMRPFAKVSMGSDFALAQNSPVYVGIKAGYFFIKDFGAFNTGVELGCKF